MQKNTQNRLTTTKMIATLGLMTALSVAIGWICKTYLTFGPIRLTFENIPIILSGVFYGPVAGAVVAAVSDIVSCITSPNPALNPIITLGAVLIGVISGIISKCFSKKRLSFRVIFTVATAHFIGSVLIKSFGLWLFWRYEIPVLLLRIPTYLLISVCESAIIYLIMKNDSLVALFNKRHD
ncbi:MAG: folate family ECF transporter S component [Ruminococcaceae bacterium]|nr:folate family ECF transporter S component [Oscillospiraceae bacterium]